MQTALDNNPPASHLRGLVQAIPDLPEARWPICVLTVCQLIGDMSQQGRLWLDTKRAVFNAVAEGRTGLAIAIMGGPGLQSPEVDERSALTVVIERALQDRALSDRRSPGTGLDQSGPGLSAAL